MNSRRNPKSRQQYRLHQRLSAYALAGTAALAGEASGAIVYREFPAPRPINGLQIDMEGGPNEFRFFRKSFASFDDWGNGTFGVRLMAVGNAASNHVLAQSTNYADRFASGELISSGMPQTHRAVMSFTGSSTTSGDHCVGRRCPVSGGEFLDERGFLGLIFKLPDGALHPGWLDVDNQFAYRLAYERDANTPILAAVPEPPSLVLLAAGAAGLAAWRRRRAKQEQH